MKKSVASIRLAQNKHASLVVVPVSTESLL